MAQFANMQKKNFGKKVLNVTTVNLIKNSTFYGFFFDAFLFQPLIKGNYVPIL